MVLNLFLLMTFTRAVAVGVPYDIAIRFLLNKDIKSLTNAIGGVGSLSMLVLVGHWRSPQLML